jgi:hypothetical protein
MIGAVARAGAMRFVVSCALAVTASAAPWRAAAETCTAGARARAEGHKRLGLELRASDPGGATREFEAANGLCPDSWYEGILAVCYEREGRINDAIKAIDAYLGHPGVDQRDQAAAARRRLEAMLAKVVVVSVPPGAALRARGPRGEIATSTPATLTLEPGRYSLDVSLAGHRPALRAIEVPPGSARTIEVALEPDALPSGRGGRSRRATALTGAAGLALDVAIPLDSDVLRTSVGLAFEAAGGVDLGRLRIMAALALHAFPDPSGFILELAGGPRLGIRLGRLPLWVEIEVLVGWSLVVVDVANAVLAQGMSSGVAIVPSVTIVYCVLRWLELFLRPARIEIFDVSGVAADGPLYRYGLDFGVRFRR